MLSSDFDFKVLVSNEDGKSSNCAVMKKFDVPESNV
jgi:hypothetical protein